MFEEVEVILPTPFETLKTGGCGIKEGTDYRKVLKRGQALSPLLKVFPGHFWLGPEACY